MPRAISALNLAELQAKHNSPAFFVHLAFDSGDVRLHTDLGTITWGGETWDGIGSLGAISTVQEGIDTASYEIDLTLSGIDATIMNEANNNNYALRPVTLYLGFFGTNGQLVDDPFEIWGGFMDSMDISLGGDEDRVSVRCESELTLFDKANGALITNEEHQDRYPGDLAFEYLEQVPTARPRWRGKVTDPAGTVITPSRGGGTTNFVPGFTGSVFN